MGTPLYIAAYKGHVKVVKILLGCEGVDINKPDSREVTPLNIAVTFRHFEIVNVLLESNLIADINVTDNEFGYAALLIAVENEHLEIVDTLLKYEGIDVNQQDKRGYSPLILGCVKGNIAIAKMLLACKDIDVNLETLAGETALSLAQTINHTEVVEVITKHLKKIKTRKRREIEFAELQEAIAAVDILD